MNTRSSRFEPRSEANVWRQSWKTGLEALFCPSLPVLIAASKSLVAGGAATGSIQVT